MKLGCLTATFSDMTLDQVLKVFRPLGLQAVELGAGNYPGSAHLDVPALLGSKPKREELKKKVKGEGFVISALPSYLSTQSSIYHLRTALGSGEMSL